MSINVIDRFFLVKKIASQQGEVHFRRWRVLQTPICAVYLHNIARSDEEKDPHDHPWSFISIILKGGYSETIWNDRGDKHILDRHIGDISFRHAAGQYHKIKLANDLPVWSLVITGPRVHDHWGYKTSSGWVDHITYRREKNAE